MNELQRIERIRRLAGRLGRPELILGIGDDCAIYRPERGKDLVFTTDFLIEGVHFLRDLAPASAVGHKALARGLSDVAAMGASPRFCLLSLALPLWADDRWVNGFFQGLLKLASRTNTALAGGDLAKGDKLTADIVVCGAVPQGKALRRDGAKPGDQIVVSGGLGASGAGFAQRKGKHWQRHLRPEPRLALGELLGPKLKATAAMDISDGLSLDLHRLCAASGVSASLTGVPVAKGATLEQALHWGEDYELLFTVPRRVKIPDELAGSPLTVVGEITGGNPGQVLWQGKPLRRGGWDHFAG
jgi:thiamine-monophosphate kinase